MSNFSEQIAIDVPSEQVWAALADYGRPHDYFTQILDAHILGEQEQGIGAVRHCDLPGRGNNYIVEEITEWNEGTSFTYVVTDTNAPITDSSVTWSVEPNGSGSIVRAEIHYEPKFGAAGWLMDVAFMNRQFRSGIANGLKSLKTELEGARVGALHAGATAA